MLKLKTDLLLILIMLLVFIKVRIFFGQYLIVIKSVIFSHLEESYILFTLKINLILIIITYNHFHFK